MPRAPILMQQRAMIPAFLSICAAAGFLFRACAANVVSDVLAAEGVQVLSVGPELQPFDRRLPETVEATLLKRFEGSLNKTQDFHADGNNDYLPEGRRHYVVSIEGGRVSGVLGSVSDDSGRMFAQLMQPGEPAALGEEQLAKPCRRHKRLATVVQKYGHMYYHFLHEVLPRVLLLRPFLDADTKLLTFGSEHEYQWLEALGISREQVEVYRPDEQYCADELLVPATSQVGSPPKENYELLRDEFGVASPVPASQRDAVVYCSRENGVERRVAGEATLLDSVRDNFPDVELVFYRGDEDVATTIALFQRAKAIVGMHGACLSHAIFADVDAAVVELLFLTDPPLMFWHAASAIGQRYMLVPLPQSWWLQHEVEVPVQDVLDALYVALDADMLSECDAGFFFWEPTRECMPCVAGTYRTAGARDCMACLPGRIAGKQGMAFCETCPVGTFSSDGFECEPCRAGTSTLLPGASSPQQCQPAAALKEHMRVMFDERVLIKKLVSMPGLEPQQPSLFRRLLRVLSPAVAAQAAAHERERYALRRRYLSELFNPEEVGTDEDAPTSHTQSYGSYGTRRMLEDLTHAA